MILPVDRRCIALWLAGSLSSSLKCVAELPAGTPARRLTGDAPLQHDGRP
jgi:hypothetical protein